MRKWLVAVCIISGLLSSAPKVWGQARNVESSTQLSSTCNFWFHIVDRDLHPVRGARLRVIYKSESVEDLTDSDGDYRGEIPCDIQYPWVNVEISANDFVDAAQTVRLSASRLQIKLSSLLVSTPNPAPTLLPTSSPTPTATPLLGSSTCPFRFQVLDANSAFVFGAQVKVIYRLDSVEGLTDSDGEYQDEIPCDIPNPRVEIEIKLNGSLVLKKTIRLEQKRQSLLITNTATPTPTFTASPTSTPITPFDVGDCVKANPRLRLRELPGVRQRLVAVLEKSEVFMILDGAEYSDGYSWWELGEFDQTSRGWAAFIDNDGEKTLILTPCQSPTPNTFTALNAPTPDQPILEATIPPATASLEITDPKNGQSVVGKCEVRWRFTGKLAQGQGFELILRYFPDINDRKKSRGVTGVEEIARKLVSHGNGEYSVIVDFSKAPSVQQFGDASYFLSVIVVQLDPYARIGNESKGVDIRISPTSIEGCKKG